VTNDEIWTKEMLYQSMPDIWWRNDDNTKFEYRCRNGEWTWKLVTDDGEILQEGYGAP
jgi:hypothetical protein